MSLFMTFLNVEFVKKLDEAYLARAAGIMESLSVVSIPVMSVFVSVAAAFLTTEWIFIAAGVLGLLLCPLFLKSKVLDEKECSE